MRYIVTGRVHPERADVSFSAIPMPVSAHESIEARCESSQLTVVVNVNEIRDHVSAFVAAEHHAQMVVSCLGFALGCGYSVELIQVVDQDAAASVFGVATDNLKFASSDNAFGRAVSLAARDLHFRLALRDYVRAMTDHLDCATYCYRAIEAINKAFVFRTGRDTWEEMHKAFGTDENSIRTTVLEFAKPIRHGNWAELKPTNSAMRNAMLVFTRDVLTRYLDRDMPRAAAAEAPAVSAPASASSTG